MCVKEKDVKGEFEKIQSLQVNGDTQRERDKRFF